MKQTYTEEQKRMITRLKAFVEGDSHSVFLMTGYAGTGKTFLLGNFARQLPESNGAVRLFAPTGRAARILAQKTGMKASTIHRAIYQHESEGVDSRKEDYYVRFRLALNDDPDNTVYLVDESSMVSDIQDTGEIYHFGSGRLLYDLFAYVRLHKSRRKIIFSGDTAQLEPFGMNFSPALDASYLRKTYSVSVTGDTLSVVHRQRAGNSVLACATLLREQLEKERADEVIITADGRQMHQQPIDADLEQYKKTLLNEHIPGSAWICYRNRDVDRINQEMRLRLGYFPEVVRQGEILMVAMNNYRHMTLFMNGDQLRVAAVSDWVETREVVFNYRQEKKVRMVLSFRDLVVEPFNEPNLRYEVKILDNALMEPDIPKLRAALFVDLVNRHRSKPKLPFEEVKKNDPYYNALIVKYGYAMTCHKAQGGEWGHTYLDLDHNNPPYARNFIRWAYTALTRSSGTVHLHNPVVYRASSAYIVEPVEKLVRKRNLVPSFDELPVTEDDPPQVRDFPFLKGPLTAIQHLSEQEGLNLEMHHFPYKVRLLYQQDSNMCTLDIGFKKKGLKNEIQTMAFTDNLFVERVRDLVRTALQGGSFHFSPEQAGRRDFYEALQGFCKESGVKITNVHEHYYCDTFILDSSETGSELSCYYDGHGRYTRLQPRSVRPDEDEKLQKLVRLLKSV